MDTVFIYLGEFLEAKCLGHMGNVCLTLQETDKLSSNVATPSCPPPRCCVSTLTARHLHPNSVLPDFLDMLVAVECHLTGFNLHFLMTNEAEHLFKCLLNIIYLYE